MFTKYHETVSSIVKARLYLVVRLVTAELVVSGLAQTGKLIRGMAEISKGYPQQ